MELAWQLSPQHILPYTGSGDGLETWVDIDLGKNWFMAWGVYETVIKSTKGLAYNVSRLLNKGV